MDYKLATSFSIEYRHKVYSLRDRCRACLQILYQHEALANKITDLNGISSVRTVAVHTNIFHSLRDLFRWLSISWWFENSSICCRSSCIFENATAVGRRFLDVSFFLLLLNWKLPIRQTCWIPMSYRFPNATQLFKLISWHPNGCRRLQIFLSGKHNLFFYRLANFFLLSSTSITYFIISLYQAGISIFLQ